MDHASYQQMFDEARMDDAETQVLVLCIVNYEANNTIDMHRLKQLVCYTSMFSLVLSFMNIRGKRLRQHQMNDRPLSRHHYPVLLRHCHHHFLQ